MLGRPGHAGQPFEPGAQAAAQAGQRCPGRGSPLGAGGARRWLRGGGGCGWGGWLGGGLDQPLCLKGQEWGWGSGNRPHTGGRQEEGTQQACSALTSSAVSSMSRLQAAARGHSSTQQQVKSDSSSVWRACRPSATTGAAPKVPACVHVAAAKASTAAAAGVLHAEEALMGTTQLVGASLAECTLPRGEGLKVVEEAVRRYLESPACRWAAGAGGRRRRQAQAGGVKAAANVGAKAGTRKP